MRPGPTAVRENGTVSVSVPAAGEALPVDSAGDMAYQQSFAGSRTSHDRTRASTVAPGATRAVDPMRLTRFMDQQHGGTNLMMVSPRCPSPPRIQ